MTMLPGCDSSSHHGWRFDGGGKRRHHKQYRIERPKTRQPPPKSERTILTSTTENPHVSYNDFAGFSDSTF
jgi:hypothetical protein